MSKRASHWKRKREFWVAERTRQRQLNSEFDAFVTRFAAAFADALTQAIRPVVMGLAALLEPISVTMVSPDEIPPSGLHWSGRFPMSYNPRQSPQWSSLARSLATMSKHIPLVSHGTDEEISALVSANTSAPDGVTDTDTSTEEAWEAGMHAMIADAHARRGSQSRRG